MQRKVCFLYFVFTYIYIFCFFFVSFFFFFSRQRGRPGLDDARARVRMANERNEKFFFFFLVGNKIGRTDNGGRASVLRVTRDKVFPARFRFIICDFSLSNPLVQYPRVFSTRLSYTFDPHCTFNRSRVE